MMRTAIVLWLVAACDAGKKSPPAPAPIPVAPVAPTVPLPDATAVVDDPPPPPCSKAALGADGDEQTVRDVDFEDCRFDLDHITTLNIDDIASQAHLGKPDPDAPKRMHVVREHDVFAIEAQSVADLKWLVRCDRPIRVDWKHDHPWVVGYPESPGVRIASMFDDGRETTLGLEHAFRPCSGANPGNGFGFRIVLLQRERDLVLRACVDPPRTPCPQGTP